MRRLISGAFFAICGLVFLALQPAFAVQPDEVLDDPALEARARDLSAELRCMVCQNQSIDDSDAELARDLRVLVRDRLEAGDRDEEVIAYVVDRYGEFVLLKPRFSYRNALLWGAPVILLLFGGH
ncbi:cytochrome c-type biogenesis protein CcmH [Nitratireductor aquibiodomus]|uniref:Cytochrome c-type biogenesis protein n=1 Tax=Nitratireductor aquibiodomus TaxID=204799 RepID=A0A1H4NA79_9HYPH|nr:cytochrome c-type biogenesis protein CcmH [Nitratireductor aquibiodomus]